MKAKQSFLPDTRLYGYTIQCPGCECQHTLCTNPEIPERGHWTFNGNQDSPTFTPSLLVKTGSFARPDYEDDPEIPPTICHSFITNGRIQFLGDCTHELANQTVDLPDIL